MDLNGLTSIALAIAFSSGVAMTMKVASAKHLKLGQFLAVNYLVCILGLLPWGAWGTIGSNSVFIWSLGIFVGIMYVLCLWLFNRAIASGGLALSATLMRLSAVIPTLGSLILFAEPTHFYQILGIVLAFVCLPLASKEPLRFDQAGKVALKGMIWALLLFAAYGMTDFAFKVQAELEPLADPKSFMVTIFGTALMITFPQLFKKNRPTQDCLFWGIALGLMNVLTTYFWIRTLTLVPGAVAYPTLGLGVIMVTTLASLLIWRERLRPTNYTFLVLASAAVLLINL